MKKVLIYGFSALALAFLVAGCNTVTSSLAYSEPLQVAEVGVVSGRALSYEQAWFNAVQAGKDAGYTAILSETTETNSMVGEVIVTLIMKK
ncbi:hypothetical protein AGMMS4952_00240 [Spirochaetia bacterium]|nr:hypothetical protein AGMMS4952_00240 [Spirochaetia bacterium]